MDGRLLAAAGFKARPLAAYVHASLGDDFNPRAFFAAGEQGIWLDPSDFSTLFQDAAGTTPVTAVGQPVGLALDKRLGLALGSELKATGTTGLVGAATAASYNTGTGTAAVTMVDSVNQSYVRFGVNSNAFHKITVSVQTNSVIFRVGTYAGTQWVTVSAGASINVFVPSVGVTEITITAATATTATFTITSVREIAGNHTYQTTLAARPTAQSNYLSLDKTDDHLLVAAGGAGTTGFLLVAGIMVPAAGTARALWSDRGTNTGYKVGIDASNQIFLSAGNGAAFVTATGPALVAGTKYVITAWHDGANLNISVNNGAPTQAAFVTATAGTATITIGKANASATEYWGDRIYGMVYRKNDRSATSQRSSLYSYMVGKMGGL